MASSDYDTYGRMHAKSLYLSEDGIRLHNNADDTQTVTLKCTPSQAGDVEISLPTSAGSLLSAGSDLEASNLVNFNAVTPGTLANADTFVFGDADASHAAKGVTAADLKTFINAGEVQLPSGTNNQVLNNNAGTWEAVNVSGDLTNAGGAFTVANGAIDNAKVAAGANIEKSKLAALNIQNSDVAAGAGIEKSKLAALEIADADIAVAANIAKSKLAALDIADADVAVGAAIAYNKLALSNSIVEGDLTNNAVTSDKLAANSVNEFKIGSNQVKDSHIVSAGTAGTAEATKFVKLDGSKDISGLNAVGMATATAQTSIEAPTFYFGTNQWRMQLSGGNLVMQKWNGVDTWVTHHTFDDGA